MAESFGKSRLPIPFNVPAPAKRLLAGREWSQAAGTATRRMASHSPGAYRYDWQSLGRTSGRNSPARNTDPAIDDAIVRPASRPAPPTTLPRGPEWISIDVVARDPRRMLGHACGSADRGLLSYRVRWKRSNCGARIASISGICLSDDAAKIRCRRPATGKRGLQAFRPAPAPKRRCGHSRGRRPARATISSIRAGQTTSRKPVDDRVVGNGKPASRNRSTATTAAAAFAP